MFGIGVPGVEPVIGYVEPGSSAEAVGLQRGDRIARVNGRKVRSWGEHRYYLLNHVRYQFCFSTHVLQLLSLFPHFLFCVHSSFL